MISSGEESARFKKLAYLVLSVLVCVDNLSAQKLRKSITTGFTKIIEGFYIDYLKTSDVNLPTSLLT